MLDWIIRKQKAYFRKENDISLVTMMISLTATTAIHLYGFPKGNITNF